MSYKHNLPAFTPLKKRTLSGANNVAENTAGRILRVVPSADVYVCLGDSKDMAIAAVANGALLKANQEYFIDCGDKNFCSFSANTPDVMEVRQEGMKRF